MIKTFFLGFDGFRLACQLADVVCGNRLAEAWVGLVPVCFVKRVVARINLSHESKHRFIQERLLEYAFDVANFLDP